MTTTDASQHDPSGDAPQARSAAGIFACYGALVALGGAVWAALGGTGNGGCGECHQAGALLPGVPLAWAGVAFYAVLAVALAGRGLTRWTRTAIYGAAGIHAVLLSLLVGERVFCGGCVLAGAGALTCAIISLAARPRAMRWAAVVFGTALLVSLGGVMAVRALHGRQQAAAVAAAHDGEGPATLPAGHVRLILYEREGCKHCLMFEEQVLPPLVQKMGDALEIERREPTVDMETPTIVVEGKGEQEFVGVPEYQELEDAVLQMQRRMQ